MNKHRYILFFAFLSLFSNGFANNKIYFYTTPLSLDLIKYGPYPFLNSAAQKSTNEMETALKDTISLASKNQIDAQELLQNLKKDLDYRIKRIEYQLEHNHTINREDLLSGTAWVGAGIGLSALIYVGYQKILKPSQDEYKNIEKEINNLGASVKFDTFTRRISAERKPNHYILQHHETIINKNVGKLANLYNTNSTIFGILGTSCIAPVGAFAYGIRKIISSFNPNADNHNLEKYKHLARVVEQLQKKQ